MDRWPISPRRLIVFVGILVLVLMVMDFNARLEELNLLRKQAGIVSIQATQAVQTEMALQTQVAYGASDQAVQDWARSEGHFVQPGDQAVVPVGAPGSTPPQIETPTQQPTSLPNWQVWWNLFFGD